MAAENDLSYLGYLRYLLEKEFPKPCVDKMIQKASPYPREDVERISNAIERFGAAAIFEAVQQ